MHRNSSEMNDLSMNSFHFQSAKIISMKRLKLIFSVLIMVIVVAGSVSAENKHECSYCHITMHADAAMLLKTSLSGLCLECHPGRSESNEHRIDIAQQHITDSSYFESDISPFLP
jgi:predicted CXXCH cytochrome family protein